MSKSTTAIHVILDRSGSMSAVQKDIIGGFNRFLKEQQDAPGKATISLVQFDDQYEVVYADKDLNKAPELTATTYVPRGTTALMDAVGRTISDVSAKFQGLAKTKRPGKVLFLIMTDGMENASREFNKIKVSDLIKKHEKDFKWKFVFVGASLESMAEANAIGLQVGNMAQAQLNNSRGVHAMYSSVSSATRKYRSKSASVACSTNFFSQEDADKLDDAKDSQTSSGT